MREKFYARKGDGKSGIMFDDAKDEIMVCGNMAVQGQYIMDIVKVLFIRLEVVPPPIRTRGTAYKRRCYYSGSANAWRIFRLNLEARDYTLTETRGFGRLMR